jgi:calcium-dependent protein kinase
MLFSGKAPFYGNSNVEIWNMAQKGPVFKAADWKNVSQEAKNFVTRLLTVDQNKRPSCAEALEDPMIMKVKSTATAATQDDGDNVIKSLISFKATSTLKKAAFEYLGSQMATKEEKIQLDKVFKALDTDNSGRLSKTEIKDGYLAQFGRAICDEELDELFTNVDIDGSGFIDYSEFIASALSQQLLGDEKRMQAAF